MSKRVTTRTTTFYGDGFSITTGHEASVRVEAPVHQVSDPVIAKHVIPALRDAAAKACRRSNCGSVYLCMRCHARKALEVLDPTWRP